MAKTKITTRKKGSKHHKANARVARKAAEKRTTAKKAKSKLRRSGGVARRSITKKQRPSKFAAARASGKTPAQLVEARVKDTIIDVIDEPVHGVVDVTEVETLETANSTHPPAS